jgi:hypothetical protein
MAMKRRYVVALITVLSICVIIALCWEKTRKNRAEPLTKNITTTHNSPQAMPKDEEISTKLLSKEVHTKIYSEPNKSHATTTLSPDKDEGILMLEQLDSPIVRHDKLAVRIALEKLNRPDLENKPSGSEIRKARQKELQIPDAELAAFSTEELLNKNTLSSLSLPILIFPCADGGLSRYAASYNGVNAFLKRPDAAKVLVKKYKEASNLVSEVEQDMRLVFRFVIMDVLMSSEQVISQLSTSRQQEEAIALIIKSIDAQARYDATLPEPAYGESTLEYSALAIAKYLEALQDAKYLQWLTQKRETGLFTKRLASTDEAKEIISMGRKYVEKY